MMLTDTIGMGRPDSYGDFPLGMVTSFAVMAVTLSIGLVSVGMRLRAEEIVGSPRSTVQA
jgi:hypothetical protein